MYLNFDQQRQSSLVNVWNIDLLGFLLIDVLNDVITINHIRPVNDLG